MESHEFYAKYANIPLKLRLQHVGGISVDPMGMTLNDVYVEIKAIDDKIRPDIIRKQKLISAFERHIINNHAK